MKALATRYIFYTENISNYVEDGRMTEPFDGKRFEWRQMIELREALGRPLTSEEAEQYRIV